MGKENALPHQGKDAVSTPPTSDTHSRTQVNERWDLCRKDLHRACQAIGLSHEFVQEKRNEEIGAMTSIFRFSVEAEASEGDGGHHGTSMTEAVETHDDATGTRQRKAGMDRTFSIQLVSHSRKKGSSEDSTSRHPTHTGFTVVKGSGTDSSSGHFKLFNDAAAAAEWRPRSHYQRLVIDANPQTVGRAFSPSRTPATLRRTRWRHTRAVDDFCGKESESKQPIVAKLDVRDLAQSTSGMAHHSRPGMASPRIPSERQQQMSTVENEQSAESHDDALLASHEAVRRRSLPSESELLSAHHRGGLSGPATTPTLDAAGRGMEMLSPSSKGNFSIADSQWTASTARCRDDGQSRPWMEAAVDEKRKLPPIGQAAGLGALWPWLVSAQQRKERRSWQGCATSTPYAWGKGNKVWKGLGHKTKVSHNAHDLPTRVAGHHRSKSTAPVMTQGHHNQDEQMVLLPQINDLKPCKFIVRQSPETHGSVCPHQEHDCAIPESKSSMF